jgi:hypothetical protein
MDNNESRTTNGRTTAQRSEKPGETGNDAVRVGRRSYIKLLGIGAAVPVAGTARADAPQGYGIGGFGTGA